MTGAEILASYLEARRHGSAVKFHRPRSVESLSATKLCAAPVFDFGHLDDPGSADRWTSELWSDLGNEYLDDPHNIELPYSEVYYIFRFARREGFSPFVVLIHLLKCGAGASSKMCYWQPTAPEPRNRWLLAPCEMTSSYGHTFNVVTSRFDDSKLEGHLKAAQTMWAAAMHATVLLNRRQQVETTTGDIGSIVIKANERRQRVKLDPIMPAIVVRIIPRDPEAIGHSMGGGWTNQPHDRRGHWRNYRSGKKVWIRDQHIHGGSRRPRDYRVLHG